MLLLCCKELIIICHIINIVLYLCPPQGDSLPPAEAPLPAPPLPPVPAHLPRLVDTTRPQGSSGSTFRAPGTIGANIDFQYLNFPGTGAFIFISNMIFSHEGPVLGPESCTQWANPALAVSARATLREIIAGNIELLPCR